MGVAEFSADMDVSALVGSAYDAMVSAKHSGGDRTVVAEKPGSTVSPIMGIVENERTDNIGTDSNYR